MATLRELKARIGSVASTEKITGAMKMISSAKMHKAELALKQLKPYRGQIETIIANLLQSDAPCTSPLMQQRQVGSVAIVVWGSDNGLCGGYNMNVYKLAAARIEELKAELGENVAITVIAIGSKVLKPLMKLAAAGVSVVNDPEVNSKSDAASIKTFTDALQQQFLDGAYDRVEALSTRFISVSRQRVAVTQLLPVEGASLSQQEAAASKPASIKPYIFEPDPERIFQCALPLFQQAVMQDIFTQNTASEQAARVMAMQSANDNARKLLEQLRLEYNKLRQQSITNELLDIVGGQVR